MQATYRARQWCQLYLHCKTPEQRHAATGLPINLAAQLLGITRERIRQLVREQKLDSIQEYDDVTGTRIGYLITFDSLDRRRLIRRHAGQWRPRELV
jgi:hypothetical protein